MKDCLLQLSVFESDRGKRYNIAIEGKCGIEDQEVVELVGGKYEEYVKLVEKHGGTQDEDGGYSFDYSLAANQFLSSFKKTLNK